MDHFDREKLGKRSDPQLHGSGGKAFQAQSSGARERADGMIYRGCIQNGVVVFEEPVSLPNGIKVRVETLDPASAPQASEFWTSRTLDELAALQGVATPKSFDELLGGWPDAELEDGFEGAVARWRAQELEPGP